MVVIMYNKRIGYHITHNDADAVGCAFVAWFLGVTYPRSCPIPKVDFKDRVYFCAIGYQDKVISDVYNDIISGNKPIPDIFIVSDISISEESCKLLEDLSSKFGTELIGFDHHKTNTLNINHKWFKVIKDNRKYKLKDGRTVNISAAMYMLKTFTRQKRICHTNLTKYMYNIVLAISDYDVWNWRNEPGYYGQNDGYDADIVQIICNILGPSAMLDTLLHEVWHEDWKNRYPDIWKVIYKSQIYSRDMYLRSISSKTRVYKQKGYKIAIFIGDGNHSNAGAEYINSNYSVDAVMVLYPSTKSISLRTRRHDLDLSVHAKNYFYGGGHQQAAGGRINNDMEFLEILRIFYIDSIPLEEWVKENDQ